MSSPSIVVGVFRDKTRSAIAPRRSNSNSDRHQQQQKKEKEKKMASAAAAATTVATTAAAAPFWRAAGMTYVAYANLCASMVRNCLKEPFKSDSTTRERVHYAVSKWADAKPEKPSLRKIPRE